MRARTHMRAGTCTHKHTKLSIKGETKLKIQVGLKMSKNEQIIFSSACSVWLFCQYLYEWKYFFFFFCFRFELHRAWPCWFALYRCGAGKGCLVACLIFLPHNPALFMTSLIQTAGHESNAWCHVLNTCRHQVFLPSWSAVILKVTVICWLEESHTPGEPRRHCSHLYMQLFSRVTGIACFPGKRACSPSSEQSMVVVVLVTT